MVHELVIDFPDVLKEKHVITIWNHMEVTYVETHKKYWNLVQSGDGFGELFAK